jgi:hypothetical protein
MNRKARLNKGKTQVSEILFRHFGILAHFKQVLLHETKLGQGCVSATRSHVSLLIVVFLGLLKKSNNLVDVHIELRVGAEA